jgi:hypothetical protein
MNSYPQNNELIPGTWKPGVFQDQVSVPAKRTALFACPVCGNVFSLSGHNIATDGIVSPSVVCPYPPCTFHEFIQILGWLI